MHWCATNQCKCRTQKSRTSKTYKFFNINGIIEIDSIQDLNNALSNINIDLYNKMRPAMEENFKIAQQFKIFKINEKEILYLL